MCSVTVASYMQWRNSRRASQETRFTQA